MRKEQHVLYGIARDDNFMIIIIIIMLQLL